MELDFSLPNLLILLGAIQGFIFSSILLIKKKQKAHLFLGIFMLTLSYNAFETFSAVSGLGGQIVFFDLFSFTAIFLLGPSFYFYVQSVLFPQKSISKASLRLHFGLPIFQLGANLILISTYVLSNAQVILIDWDFGRLYGFFDAYSEPLSVIAFSVYVVMAVNLYLKTKNDQKQLVYPNTFKLSVLRLTKTLLIMLSGFTALWALVYALSILGLTGFNQGYYPIEIALIFFIYWISFANNHKMQLIHSYLEKSKQSLISQAEASLKIAQLQALMSESKLYLNPKMTREQLAKEAKISPRLVSSILNQHLGQSFNDFINSYRLEEVKAKLNSSKLKTQTITGIAFDAGFNSQATFQRVFKNTLGMSPKEYVAQKSEKVTK